MDVLGAEWHFYVWTKQKRITNFYTTIFTQMLGEQQLMKTLFLEQQLIEFR